MGLPRSFLPLLHNLRKDERYSSEAELAVSPFSLFAFVIDSPDSDKRVSGRLEEEFSYLNLATGDDLLFFSPIDEPQGWRENMEQSVGSSILDLYEKIPERLRSGNPERAQRIFAQSLGIQKDDLPVIILSAKLQDRKYFVLRTSKAAINGQLISLGNLAREIGRREKRLCIEELARPEIDLCSGLYTGELVQNLAGLLHDSLSLIVSAKKQSSCDSPGEIVEASLARSNMRNRCHELVIQLNEISPVRAIGSEDDAGTPMIYQTLETLARLLAGLSQSEQENFIDYPLPAEIDWELESKEWWAIGNTVYDFLTRPQLILEEKGLGEEVRSLDKAPALVCWSKALENELNLSAGQWIRRELGISIPEFFNRHQPQKQAIFEPSKKYSLDFNRPLHDSATHDGLRLLELGPLTGAVNWYLKRAKGTRIPLAEESINAIGENFERIRLIRNRACHPSRMHPNDARDFQDAVRELNSSGALVDMSRIKGMLMRKPVPAKRPGPLYLYLGGRVLGPYGNQSLEEFIKEGRITKSDLACLKSTKKWKPLSAFL